MERRRGASAGPDVIVIGAGLGGLACGAKLARAGRRVLILERKPHAGGTGFFFVRKGFKFPMGPLGFSFPDRVRAFLAEAGADAALVFRRSHFQFLSPALDLVYSRPLPEIEAALSAAFPAEAAGLARFMAELDACVRTVRSAADLNPDFLAGGRRTAALASGTEASDSGLKSGEACPDVPSAERLALHLGDANLRNFLGSMGSAEPRLSLVHLAFMWAIMAEEGIWFPDVGIHGLTERLEEAFLAAGGELRLGTPVRAIVTSGGRATGVVTEGGETIEGGWIVSNADAKRTLLELAGSGALDPAERERIRSVPYSDSEFCVYLGLDPGRVDWRRMKARHLFFRKGLHPGRPSGPEDFEEREIEICRWGEGTPDLVPAGKAALVLRVGFPYDYFASWRTGDKMRRVGYREYKLGLAGRLIETIEAALPGLSTAVEVMEVATPLTYLDWGGRSLGSIAGWAWSAESLRAFPQKLLVETSLPNLLLAGVYAVSELFLGGVPTALHTGLLAADLILERS